MWLPFKCMIWGFLLFKYPLLFLVVPEHVRVGVVSGMWSVDWRPVSVEDGWVLIVHRLLLLTSGIKHLWQTFTGQRCVEHGGVSLDSDLTGHHRGWYHALMVSLMSHVSHCQHWRPPVEVCTGWVSVTDWHNRSPHCTLTLYTCTYGHHCAGSIMSPSWEISSWSCVATIIYNGSAQCTPTIASTLGTVCQKYLKSYCWWQSGAGATMVVVVEMNFLRSKSGNPC